MNPDDTTEPMNEPTIPTSTPCPNCNTKNFNDWWEETGQHLPLNPLDTARDAWDAASAVRSAPASTPPDPAAGSEPPFARRAADVLAYECAREVMSGRLDGRSGIADALLNYLNVGGFGGPADVIGWMRDYEQNEKRKTNQIGGGQ